MNFIYVRYSVRRRTRLKVWHYIAWGAQPQDIEAIIVHHKTYYPKHQHLTLFEPSVLFALMQKEPKKSSQKHA